MLRATRFDPYLIRRVWESKLDRYDRSNRALLGRDGGGGAWRRPHARKENCEEAAPRLPRRRDNRLDIRWDGSGRGVDAGRGLSRWRGGFVELRCGVPYLARWPLPSERHRWSLQLRHSPSRSCSSSVLVARGLEGSLRRFLFRLGEPRRLLLLQP